MKGTLFRGQSIDGKRGVTEGGGRSGGVLPLGGFCCLWGACVMPCHARNEWPIFRGERCLLYRLNFRFFVPISAQCVPALLAGCLLDHVSFRFLCHFLIFYGGPSLSARVVCNGHGMVGLKILMDGVSGRGVGVQARAKKKPAGRRVGGHRETDARGWGACAPRGRGGRGHLPSGWPIRPWRRRSDGPLRPS